MITARLRVHGYNSLSRGAPARRIHQFRGKVLLKHLTALELMGVLNAGGGVTVSGLVHSPLELRSMALRLQGNAVLHVVDSHALTALEMQTVAAGAKGPAYVMFSGKWADG
jgi:Tfp pilus assembly protein PilN